MTTHILSIGLIYLCTCAAWWILGTTVYVRSNEFAGNLRQGVQSAWGSPQRQESPRAWYCQSGASESQDDEKTKRGCAVDLPLAQSRITTALALDHRRKGLVWYSTYGVDFRGAYRVTNTTAEPREVSMRFTLPAGQAVFDGFTATVNGEDVSQTLTNATLTATRTLAPGEALAMEVAYRSQGLDQWTYALPKGVSQVNDFLLTMRTNFRGIDYPAETLAATSRKEFADGWELEWQYASLLSNLGIGMAMPAHLQPGDLVGRITFFAPVALLFYFFLLLILTVQRNINLHAMNYFFLAAAFFAFHLLLAYTVDHIDIHVAFVLSAAVSIFLVVSYLRIVAGMRFALREAGLLQFIYLVGFSYTFFLEGYSALCVTVASIITLYAVMQLTARVNWAERFSRRGNVGVAPPPMPQH
ncbi:MAG: inner membrane CreD family protein [Bryobacterales bacterium]|nr:inner membrane CreD family protein [Bryobacterales bacterium]